MYGAPLFLAPTLYQLIPGDTLLTNTSRVKFILSMAKLETDYWIHLADTYHWISYVLRWD